MNTLVSWLRRADATSTAVVDDEGRVTYGELVHQSQQLAAAFLERYGSSRYLLIPAERHIGFLRGLVAACVSGKVPVPVDPGAPDRVVGEIGGRCGDWGYVDLKTEFEHLAPLRDVRTEPGVPELVLFTSGTSGTPKGVLISGDNLAYSARAVSNYLDYARNPSAAVVLPLHYSYALLSQVLFMFYVGGCVRLFSDFRNPIAFSRAVEAEELRTFCGVPSTYAGLCAIHRLTPLSMPSVRVICSAGAAMDRSLLPEIKQMFPSSVFFDNYGMTEATPRISYLREDDPRFSEPTCGTPIDGLEVRVLDERDFSPLEEGGIGIIAIRGPNVFGGYLNDPESTRRAFTANGFVLSGDIGYMRGGYLYVQGRRDEVFNVGGEKVAPAEIERALAEHPYVLSCAVNGLHDKQRGDVPVAYVQLLKPVNKRDLTEFLRDMLPPVKVPVRVFEVRSFPLTSNGKLQRSRLSPDNSQYVLKEIL